jgi:hypothetical protein
MRGFFGRASLSGHELDLGTTPENKSLLVLFFRKEQESSFSEEKEAKRLLFLVLCPDARQGMLRKM